MEGYSAETSFPYSDSLLFQFIFFELLQVQHKLMQLEHLLASQNTLQERSSLRQHLDNLSSSQDLLPWASDLQYELGHLARLKQYAQQFQGDENSRELLTLRRISHKIWLLAVQLCDLAKCGNTQKKLCSILAKIVTELPALRKSIAGFIGRFRDDENFIYFMLAHHVAIDKTFGEGFTLQQFTSMHGGLKPTVQFLLNSYARRHFNKLLPIIAQKATAFEKSLTLSSSVN